MHNINDNNADEKAHLILASASPRRKYLLEQAGLRFSVCVSRFDESLVPWSEPVAYTRELAVAKAAEVADRYPSAWVIGADTIVVADGEYLGKPLSREDARRMLSRLSDSTHQVYTGYAVIGRFRDHYHSEVVRTGVTFKALSPQEIEWYINTTEPYDKAGAYAVQGLGSRLVREVQGSYTNVVGLPLCQVMEHLLGCGIVQLEETAVTSGSRRSREIKN